MSSILSRAASKMSIVGRRSNVSSELVRRSVSAVPSSWASFFNLSNGNDSSSKVPKTFRDAMLEQKAAIVVTTAEAPHTILYVNDAWERMCGYSKEEVMDHTLECIQGADTNKDLADSGLQKLHQQKDGESDVVDMYLINYKKNGSSFTNHLQMGTLKLNEMFDDVKMFVGVLEEVQPNQVPLRMV